MEAKTINSEKVQKNASYVMLFLSGFGIGYSIMKYFLQADTEVKWSSILPLFIISVIVFSKNILALKNK